MFLIKNQIRKNKHFFIRMIIISGVLLWCFFVISPSQKIIWRGRGVKTQLISSSIQNRSVNLSRSALPKNGVMGGPLEINVSKIGYSSIPSHPILIDREIITTWRYPIDDQLIDLSSASRQIKEYIVQPNDSIEKIASKFGISVQTVLWANHLSYKSIIKPGDKLTILPINGIRIKIKKGDTISRIAQKYQAKVKEIIKYNQIADINSISEKDYLIIPGGEMSPYGNRTLRGNRTFFYKKYTPPKSWLKKTWQKFTHSYSSMPMINSWLVLPAHGYDWGILHYCNAIDIANHCGTPIHAAAAGTVILADNYGWNGGYGHYVKIRHSNGVITLYAHFQSIYVKKGQKVQSGEVIGLMGTTGHSTGCHLHFEVRGAKNPLAGRGHWL